MVNYDKLRTALEIAEIDTPEHADEFQKISELLDEYETFINSMVESLSDKGEFIIKQRNLYPHEKKVIEEYYEKRR